RAALLADEPARKLEHLDALADARLVAAGRRLAKGLVDVEPAADLGELDRDRVAQARLVDLALAPLPPAPKVEAADQHRLVDEVDHRTGTVGRDDLAASDCTLGPRRVGLAALARLGLSAGFLGFAA